MNEIIPVTINKNAINIQILLTPLLFFIGSFLFDIPSYLDDMIVINFTSWWVDAIHIRRSFLSSDHDGSDFANGNFKSIYEGSYILDRISIAYYSKGRYS